MLALKLAVLQERLVPLAPLVVLRLALLVSPLVPFVVVPVATLVASATLLLAWSATSGCHPSWG